MMLFSTNRQKTNTVSGVGSSKLIFLLFIACVWSSALFSKDFNDSEIRHIGYPEWFIDSTFLELSSDLENAIANGKKGLMVLFTTEGCSYCDKFIHDSLGNPEIAAAVQRNFDSIGLEIFDDAEMLHPDGSSTSIKNFANAEGAEYSPTILFFGQDGTRFLRLVGYQKPEYFKNIVSYIEHGQPGEKFRDYLKRHSLTIIEKAQYRLKSDPIFEKPPYMLDRSKFQADKPLLVIFESNDCAECKNFHTKVLSLAEVRQELARFEVVRLDSEDVETPVITPSGAQITPQQWYREKRFTKLPALVFFDEKGNEVQQTDSLVLRQRMLNSLGFVLERAYEKDWTYQRFARSKGIERAMQKNNNNKN